ncbi:hydroxymethylpyrimidine/phosphomethylpyrimidine kinase [Thermoclostridium stercorarium subsp. leptospartum DSM 9219]|uniref:Hydroxymethylpyrimidine/phosphomethylpyrimidine kinase n=1 Tax=Thermoclostridium stercorarium subsp. leptospartum DSM 9219 TaxID=1346611 RepID=A0A1B1YLP0_THEST|nr:bifunctional hydroxymethylpyrimidine kinase/phosphomethylpyrimidine kinase [Thermoclostridium stercorarium]ANX01688.1 hydroxymethylpyrimidine/phosphomethylpyrimidine kinase [Thermoclostridium stercorarium subsp. leptospartum DSM 9219]
MKTVLTVAGSDSSGGAGIQADIKTMTANGIYAMSAITALTAQNTTGVSGIMEVTPEFLGMQLDSIFTDIYPDAVKIGMVSSAPLIEIIAEKLKYYNARNIVVDPVMVSTSGSKLLQDNAIEALRSKLFPMAVVITPNIPEASILSGISIENREDMIKAAEIIGKQFGCAVLCKGEHSVNDADDLLYCDNRYKWFRGERINNKNTHGTGCTLSSAIACGLAKGMDLETAIQSAKDYVTGALKSMLKLGKGNGPIDHMWNICKNNI